MYEIQSKNAMECWGALKQNKFSDETAAGILGNIQVESDFINNVTQSGDEKAFGMFKFDLKETFPKYAEYCNANSLDMKSIQAQCNFMITQLKDCFTKYTGKTYTYKNGTTTWWPTKMTLNEFKKKKGGTSGVSTCAEIFCRVYKRPSVPHMDMRKKYAKEWYSKLKDTNNGDTKTLNFDFNKTTEKLLSSENYEYIKNVEKETPQYSETSKSLVQQYKTTINSLKDIKIANSQFEKYVVKTKNDVNISRKSTFGGPVNGSTFPIAKNIVESPFIEVTLGGETFGTFSTRRGYSSYPNYVQSLTVERVNGTLNNYSIQLIHQIMPGDNPNYISNLLSSNGFNKISLRYGDGASATIFRDTEALISDVSTSFNISSSLITYTLTATSVPKLLSSIKKNFPSVTDKPSNVIMQLSKDIKQSWNTLKTTSASTTDLMCGLSNLPNLLFDIPSNDKSIDIEAVRDKTYLEYISYLTSLMTNKNDDIKNSSYYLTIDTLLDNTTDIVFKVTEIYSDVVPTNKLIYEVDLGYPDDSMVFDFSVSNNYAWSATYNSSLPIKTYSYDITNYGDISKNKSLSIYDSTWDSNTAGIAANAWKHLTRFPITAQLTIKGLVQPIMLLTYVKINNYYYGNKRITSGMYIVTSQIDKITSGGYITVLGLTRVASDIESITVDGRVRT